MMPFSRVFTVPAVTVVVLGALAAQPLADQYGRARTADRVGAAWENNRVRLSYVSVEPGQSLPADGNQVLIYLTAGPDGRILPDAIWQAAGGSRVENRGRARLDAIAIELKDAGRGAAAGTAPEALDVQYGVDVTPLVDNDRVLVAKHRYDPTSIGAPPDFHGEDVLVVYLRGGYTWPADGSWGAVRVRRGDVDVLPANTLHQISNAGSDPLELLVVIPR